jgi:hypothetical protein
MFFELDYLGNFHEVVNELLVNEEGKSACIMKPCDAFIDNCLIYGYEFNRNSYL